MSQTSTYANRAVGGSGGIGGDGGGYPYFAATTGDVNTGSGGGGSHLSVGGGQAGGSGVCIIKYKYQ